MAMSHEDKLDHQLDAERAVIGSLLIDAGIVRDVVATVDVNDFLNPANRLIYQTARALFRDGSPVDAVAIRDRIGPDYSKYMMELMEITPTSANWREYAAMMHAQATLQRVRNLADKLATAVTLEDCRPLCADLGQLISDGRKTDAWTMREMLDDFFAAQDPDTPAPEYVSFGLPDVDEGAFAELGDVVMLGGYPSDGKTALALMMAYHMAAKYKVGFFSLETGKRKVRDRMVSHVAQISAKDIKLRNLSEEDWAALAAKSADTHEPVYSDWISSARTDAPVDIIPSDTALVQAEAAALKEDARFNRHAMSDLFRAIREDADAPDADNRQSAYDYVLIDCSPAFSQVSLAALRDADDIIVPITTDLFSTMGMATVLKQIMRARKDGLNSVAGVLVNKYQRVEDPNGLLTYLRNQKAVPTFETVIRKSKKVVSAGADGVPLIKFSPRCAAARDYRAFVAEYMAKKGDRNGKA